VRRAGEKLRYWAVRGGGAFLSRPQMADTKLRVSDVRDLASARSFLPPREWASDAAVRRAGEALAAATHPHPAWDHPALMVAAGVSDLCVFFTAGPWDLAGPALVVEEAGGRFSDLLGQYDFTSGTAVFSNGYLHDAVVQFTSPA
jgi:histidinol-phosphatase